MIRRWAGLLGGLILAWLAVPAWGATDLPAAVDLRAEAAAAARYGAPLVVIIATAAMVNLRFMMYSVSLGPHFRPLKGYLKALFAYLITDQAYALSIVRFMKENKDKDLHWFYFGLASAIWACWQVATIIGILLGNLVPPDWSLDFIVPLTFIDMVVPLLSDRAMLVAAALGGLASVLLVLPLKLNLIAAALIGIAAGLAAEKLQKTL